MMPRVHRVTKPNGDVFKYHRRTRRPLPNDVSEDHPDFIRAWQAQEQSAPKPRTRGRQGTIQHGCEEFLRSKAYLDLAAPYRAVIGRHARSVSETYGKAMLRDLRPEHIRSDLSPLTPAVASSRLKAWRKMTGFWHQTGMTLIDAADSVKRKAMPRTDGHKEWTQADVDTFRDHWPIGTPQRLALELLQWTGVRCVDLVRLGPGMIDAAGLLRFRQSKTGVEANVPWTAPAFGLEPQRANLMLCLEGHKAMVFLLTAHGKARSQKSISSWFSSAATDAKLPGLTAHGLRKYRMNQMAEHGVPLLGMQSWVGHATLSEVERYTRKAARRNVFFVNQPTQFTKTPNK